MLQQNTRNEVLQRSLLDMTEIPLKSLTVSNSLGNQIHCHGYSILPNI